MSYWQRAVWQTRTSRRAFFTLVVAVMLRHGVTPFAIRAQRRTSSFVLSAWQPPRRRQDFLSIDQANVHNRPLPPTLDTSYGDDDIFENYDTSNDEPISAVEPSDDPLDTIRSPPPPSKTSIKPRAAGNSKMPNFSAIPDTGPIAATSSANFFKYTTSSPETTKTPQSFEVYQEEEEIDDDDEEEEVQEVVESPSYERVALQNPFAFIEEGDDDDDEVLPPSFAASIVSSPAATQSVDLDSILPPDISKPKPQQQQLKPKASNDTPEMLPPQTSSFYQPKTLSVLESELDQLQNDIFQQNDGMEFNINSPRQVAQVLYGESGGSTRRDILEGMAGGGNRMAGLIVQYRILKQRITRMIKRQDSFQKGTAVTSASSVARDVVVTTDGTSTTSSPLQQQETDPLILVDASAYIFRAYYSMPPIHRADGLPTGAVMGFCKMLNSMLLNRMLKGEQPRLVMCFDAKGDQKTFRHDLYPDYKGNRPPVPMDLAPQFEFVRQAAEAYGILRIEATKFEADDVIATLATMAVKEGIDANILSGDKDLMQLVTGQDETPSVQLIDPMKRDRTTYTQVVEKWAVPPEKLGDVLALAGDAADNIPGVHGIGPKTAAKLINEYGSLENVLENIENIKQKGIREKLQKNSRNARLSRELVELDRAVPLETLDGFPVGLKVGDLRMEPVNAERILKFYNDLGFRELRSIFLAREKGVKHTKRKSPWKRKEKVEIPKPEDYADVPF